MAEDSAVEGSDGNIRARRAEIGHQEVPGFASKRQLTRRTSSRRWAEVALCHQTAFDEFGDSTSHDRAAQAGALDEVGP